MAIVEKVLSSNLKRDFLKTKENISVVCISKDNKSFCINVVSNKTDRTDGRVPNSIILSEQPLEGFGVICRIMSDRNLSKDMFTGKCRVIANSLENKLKSFTIIKELRNCI